MKASEQMRISRRQIEELELLINMQTRGIDSLHQVEWYLMQALREAKRREASKGNDGSHGEV